MHSNSYAFEFIRRRRRRSHLLTSPDWSRCWHWWCTGLGLWENPRKPFPHTRTTPEINQFDLHGVGVHRQVLRFDVPVEDAALTADVSGLNDLPHNMSCCLLVEASSLDVHETQQVRARRGPLHDHDIVVCVVLPVQKFNYVRNAGAFISHQCQADLQGEMFRLTRLKERKYDS